MATKSILKSIDIRDTHRARKFVKAMEDSKTRKQKSVVFDRKVRDATEEDIRTLADKLAK